MRRFLPIKLEQARVSVGEWATDAGDLEGVFLIGVLKIISSGPQGGWEHVSVSTYDRTPTWEEMHFIKDLFWSPEECVMQLHPPESEYVNFHPYCLHLWRPTDREIPMPPSTMVGLKSNR